MEQNPTNTFMSTEINEIATALSAFQGSVEQPKLNKENPYFKSKYVDLSGVFSAVQGKLCENGLSVSQIIMGENLITLLTHKSGQWLKSICPIGNYKSQQDRGSAITYSKRYALCAMLGIASDVDDDGNAATAADKSKTDTNLFAQAIKELEAVSSRAEYESVFQKYLNVDRNFWRTDTPHYMKLAEIGSKYPKSKTNESHKIKG